MKKITILSLCLLLMSACTLTHQKGDPIELTPQEVIDKLQDEKQNSFLLYLTMDKCYTCTEFEKVIVELEEESHFDIYYVKIDQEEENSKAKAAMEELAITIGDYTQLPMTYYFYQGSLLPENKKDGYLEKKDLKKWLKELQIIK